MAERKTILLRISPQMWEDINKWAEDEFRSVNGQIEYILQNALREQKRLKPNKADGSVTGDGKP